MNTTSITSRDTVDFFILMAIFAVFVFFVLRADFKSNKYMIMLSQILTLTLAALAAYPVYQYLPQFIIGLIGVSFAIAVGLIVTARFEQLNRQFFYISTFLTIVFVSMYVYLLFC